MVDNSTMCNITLAKLQELSYEYKNSDQAGDATWILTSAFIIFTMQSGFGLLEAGSVTMKNECNIMVKNAIDVIFGGLGYWLCGFAFSFGDDKTYSNGFTGFGKFLLISDDTDNEYGELYAKYFFQLSFATTATTIVSGAMAERTNLKAYIFFSCINFISYVFPAHWIWADNGFLKKLGVVDVAGCGPVHIVGGASSLIATIMLKPRMGVFNKKSSEPKMASPTNVVLGTFMLWWGWLGFNCGSTFGVSGGKWKLASRAAVATVNASIGGGIWSVFYCYALTKRFKGKLDVGTFTGCILGGLVSITGICALCKPWEALIVGTVGGAIVCYATSLVRYLKVDDPVSCVPVHLFCGIWGMLSVGLLSEKDKLEGITKTAGIFKGGPITFFGYQCIAALTICAWALVTSALQLFIADLIFGLRMCAEGEYIGADAFEHGILSEWDSTNDKKPFSARASSAFGGRNRTRARSHEDGGFPHNKITHESITNQQYKDKTNVCYKQNEVLRKDLRHVNFVRSLGTRNFACSFEDSMDSQHTELNFSLRNLNETNGKPCDVENGVKRKCLGDNQSDNDNDRTTKSPSSKHLHSLNSSSKTLPIFGKSKEKLQWKFRRSNSLEGSINDKCK